MWLKAALPVRRRGRFGSTAAPHLDVKVAAARVPIGVLCLQEIVAHLNIEGPVHRWRQRAT